MHTTSVPLDTLTISPANVRRADASIDDLVASIAAHGLLNPLTVVAEGDGFQVIAGGRRLRALQQLKIDPVPIVLVADDADGELSLTENMSRVAMSTLDTLRALRRITDEQPPEPAPGTMTDDEVAAQEAFVSAALDEGIDEFTEADEVAEAAE